MRRRKRVWNEFTQPVTSRFLSRFLVMIVYRGNLQVFSLNQMGHIVNQRLCNKMLTKNKMWLKFYAVITGLIHYNIVKVLHPPWNMQNSFRHPTNKRSAHPFVNQTFPPPEDLCVTGAVLFVGHRWDEVEKHSFRVKGLELPACQRQRKHTLLKLNCS